MELHANNSELKKLSPALRAVMLDGMAWAVMVGFGETYLSAFAIFLGATALQIAVLATTPQFIGAFVQLVSVWSQRFFKSRRAVVVKSAAINAALWFPVAILPHVMGIGAGSSVVLIILAILYQVSGQFGSPIWNSLVGDLIPPESRGRFFGLRNRLTGACTFVALMLGGGILHGARGAGIEAYGFSAIFLLACAFRGLSAYWLGRYDDPEYEVRREDYFSFWSFLKRAPRSNYARFVFFTSFVSFAVAFSGPFFSVYMLRELKMSYLEFMVVSAANTITQFMTIQYWGTLSDRYGNKKILNVCGFAVCLSPVLWIFGSEIWYLLLIQIYGGFVWAGYNLASANFIFDAVTPGKRARCAAYHGLVGSAFVLAGSLAGAYVIEGLHDTVSIFGLSWTPASRFFVLFLVSGAMRLVTASLLLPLFREVREVEPIKHGEFIARITGLRATAGATFGVFSTGLRSRWNKRKQSGVN